jgi:hypothetical protein
MYYGWARDKRDLLGETGVRSCTCRHRARLRPHISRIIGEQLSEVDGKLKRQCNEEQQNEGERMTKEACKRLTEEIRLSHSRKYAQ